MSENRGILFLAIGKAYYDYALQSIKALRALSCRDKIKIITDQDTFDVPDFDVQLIKVRQTNIGFESRFFKTQLFNYSFDITLFLDADTLAINAIDKIWDVLENADIAFCRDMHSNVADVISNSINEPDRRKIEYEYMQKLHLENHKYFNSGVMIFRKNNEVETFFQRWHLEWKKFKNEDQLAMVRALNETSLKVVEMPSIWNKRPKLYSSKIEALDADVKILHFLSRQRSLMEKFL